MHVYFFYGFFPACMLLLPMHVFIFFQKFGRLHFYQNITYIQIDLIWTNGCVKTEFVWCRSNFYIIIWHKSSVKIAYLHLHVYYFFEKNPPYTVISSCTFIRYLRVLIFSSLLWYYHNLHKSCFILGTYVTSPGEKFCVTISSVLTYLLV